VPVFDAVAELQASLGVDQEIAQDLSMVLVECPIPGEARLTSLGDFMGSDHGAAKAGQILEAARRAKESGATPEESLQRALGFAAVINQETGMLQRAEPSISPSATESHQDSKKK
jgi:hypothetical protein